MTDTAKRNLVAQWAFDTRPVLLRFHLWLEDVEVERSQAEPVSAHSFAPRGIARCLAMTSAATALGTRLFGDYGGAAAKDKATVNQVKKAADAVSAYVMSEGLWHLTRTLPENHALMVCLGEGLMPKVGETPEMGANPMLGFGRVYARPELAKTVDRRVRRLRQEPGPSAGAALGGVGKGRRSSHRGRLEGAVGPRRLHGLRDVRAHLPRRQLEGRRRGHPRLPLRWLRGDRRGDAGSEPFRRAGGAQHDVAVLADVRAAGRRRGPVDAARSIGAGLRRAPEDVDRRPRHRGR